MITLNENKIWCFWANKDNMSEARKKSLDILVNTCGVKVELITDKNFIDFESSQFPIHQAYKYLSDTHKSEYMRFYLCHVYGGGYADIKPFSFNWLPFFNFIDENVELVGSPEAHPSHVASQEHQQFFRELISVHHFILKKNSVISNKLMKEINEFLDFNFDRLKKNPGTYHHRAVNKLTDETGVFQPENSKIYDVDYPIGWNEISGRIFHKIQYENRNKILNIMSPSWNFFSLSSYR